MSEHDETLNELATIHNTRVVAVRHFVKQLIALTGSEWFYIFWFSGTGAGAKAASAKRSRTLVAFTTPDVALAFAQQNQLIAGETHPRLRRLSVAQLLLAMAREATITDVLFVNDLETMPSVGRLPKGIQVERIALAQQLRAEDAVLPSQDTDASN